MKQLYIKKIPISEENILLYFVKEKDVRAFRWKHKIPVVTQEEILEVTDIMSLGKEDSQDFFNDIYDSLADVAFRRFVYNNVKDILYHIGFVNHQIEIANIAKAIAMLYPILRRSKIKTKRSSTNGIKTAAININQAETTIPTFSKEINKYTMGWSRGYPNALLARSSHGKSTFIFNEIRHKVTHNIVGKIAVISPEENDTTFWRRAFANEYNISTSLMRAGLVKITDEQVWGIEKKYEGRVDFFHEGMVKYSNVVDLLFSLEDYEMIIIDHVTAIEYPGSGNQMQNLTGGIISLVHRENDFLSKNKQATIINVNQVREKDIEQSIKSYWKAPTYTMAYGNSVTYVACREWITLYYPYRDLINRSNEWMGVQDLPTINDLHIMVEKSSFGDIGSGVLQFIPEYAKVMDRTGDSSKKHIESIQESLFQDATKKKTKQH